MGWDDASRTTSLTHTVSVEEAMIDLRSDRVRLLRAESNGDRDAVLEDYQEIFLVI